MASRQQLNPAQAHDQGQAQAERATDSARSKAHSALNKTEDAAHRTHEKAQEQESGSFLQQTGEKVANMTQGAVDGVKNTLGIGEQQKK